MKKILLTLSIIMMMTSCSSYISSFKPDPFYTTVSFIDYSLFSSKGIFVTESNSVSFPYEPIGSICVKQYSGTESKKISIPNDGNEIYNGETKKHVYHTANIEELSQRVNDEIKKYGGNGIINLRISSFVEQQYRSGLMVTGMVIKK